MMGISTQEIDNVSAEIAIGMITENPDYEILAARICASNIQKRTPKKFSKAMKILFSNKIICSTVWKFVSENSEI